MMTPTAARPVCPARLARTLRAAPLVLATPTCVPWVLLTAIVTQAPLVSLATAPPATRTCQARPSALLSLNARLALSASRFVIPDLHLLLYPLTLVFLAFLTATNCILQSNLRQLLAEQHLQHDWISMRACLHLHAWTVPDCRSHDLVRPPLCCVRQCYLPGPDQPACMQERVHYLSCWQRAVHACDFLERPHLHSMRAVILPDRFCAHVLTLHRVCRW